MAAPIAEFLASVGFAVDSKSLKSALAKVAGFGAAVSAAAGAALAGMIHISQAEKDLAAQVDLLGVPIEKMEQLKYIARPWPRPCGHALNSIRGSGSWHGTPPPGGLR